MRQKGILLRGDLLFHLSLFRNFLKVNGVVAFETFFMSSIKTLGSQIVNLASNTFFHTIKHLHNFFALTRGSICLIFCGLLLIHEFGSTAYIFVSLVYIRLIVG